MTCLSARPRHQPTGRAGQGARRCLGTKPRPTSPLTWASCLSLFVTMPIPHPRRINVKSFMTHFSLGGVLQASWGFMPFLMPFLP